MPNSTLTIQNCKLHNVIIGARNYAHGKISWKDGGHDFSKGFFTISIECVAVIEANKFDEFCATGYLVKKKGVAKYAGKIFEDVCLTAIKICKNG